MYLSRFKGIDFYLDFAANDYYIEGQPKNNFSQYTINYNGNNRKIDRETGLIIEKIMTARPFVSENDSDIYQITHAEIEKYYLNQLPPVDVVAKAPAPAKNGTNKKMLVVGLLVVVCVLAVMAAKPKKRKR